MAELAGRVVAILEARRAAELAGIVARHGGVAYPAPSLREIHRPEAPELASAVDRLCGPEADAVVFLTGVGAGTLFDAARLLGREQALLRALATKRVAVRGPKPAAALRRAGVRIDLQTPEPHTSRELLRALEAWDLRDRTVVVQLYGGPNPGLRAALAARGARVVEVSPYRWDLPADAGPVLRLLDDLHAGRVDVLAATSASQVANLFELARRHERAAQLRAALGCVPVAAQGPVCAAAFARQDVAVSIMPDRGHMGALVLAIARHFAGDTRPRAALDPTA